MRHRPRWLLALLAYALTSPAYAQTYYWSGGGSDTSWSTGENWSPNGPPGNSDNAVFNSFGAAAGTTSVNPTLTANRSLNSLVFAPNQTFGGWTLGQDGSNRTLTIGGSSSTGLTTYGPATYTIDGVKLQGVSSTNTLALTVTNGSYLKLSGVAAATTNIATSNGINIIGGTMLLDNTSTKVATRLATGSTILMRSGTLEVLGNSEATTYTLGGLSTASTGMAGVNVIRVNPSNAVDAGVPTVTFANGASGVGFSLRPTTFMVLQFESTGVLGTDAKITFTGNPFTGANGLLSHTLDGQAFGHAIVRDDNGVDFATWTHSDGVKAAGATEIKSSLAAISSTNNTSRVYYNPTDSETATGILNAGSLRITPGESGLTLSMGAHNLGTHALMLNGSADFTISGTGAISSPPLSNGDSGGGPKFIYVNDASATLTVSLAIQSGGDPTSIAGPGIVALNGTTRQITSASSRLNLLDGVLRGNNTNIGFRSSLSSSSQITFRGGVLELSGGSNMDGNNADFIRSLGTTSGRVSWKVVREGSLRSAIMRA